MKKSFTIDKKQAYNLLDLALLAEAYIDEHNMRKVAVKNLIKKMRKELWPFFGMTYKG